MPKQMALFVFALFIAWLFMRDRKLRPMSSTALWIPLLWIFITGSRPFSLWFGADMNIASPEDYIEGSPFDRYVFLFLIAAAFMVLLRRRVNPVRLTAGSLWLALFFIYCLISVAWSDYPFVSFKRWIKDVGNVAMILVVLTEADPLGAVRAVFARCTYLAVPLSVLFIKYYPDIGRYYNRWTWEPSYCGVATEKNALGTIALVCGIFLVWDFVETRASGGLKGGKLDFAGRVVLVLMVAWLLMMSHSSTSTVCLLIGAGIVVAVRLRPFKRRLPRLGTYSLALCFFIFLLYISPDLLQMFTGAVGRNATFTGRTGIWADLLQEHTDPLVGTGYQSFWLGAGAERMWQKYYFHPNQAHNGYLETYLNEGLIGLGLLLAAIVSTGNRLKGEMMKDSGLAILCYSFFIVALISNMTEATFNRLGLIWIIFLLAAVTYPPRRKQLREGVPA